MQEIEFYGGKYKKMPVDSIFFGGGTPSLMEPRHIADIIEALKQAFDVAAGSEISMECNPKTLNADNLAGFKAAGVNRLSIGVQSFDDEILKGLGRVHKAGDAIETIKLARKAGFDNINIDLMFAVPRQNMDKWLATVKQALELKPEHISFYSLEIAEGTPFDKMVENGEMKETPVELDREMYAKAMEMLAEAGYEHYEISNAAFPGKECKHNEKYWHFEDYLGLGPSAHSFVGGVRMFNPSDLEKYMADPTAVEDTHINDFYDNVSEYVFTALRTKKGVDFDKFKNTTGEEFWSVFRDCKEEFRSYVTDGFAVEDEKHIALTKEGINISNKIMAIFV